MHRVHVAGVFNGLAHGRQRLSKHLATEQLAKAQILTAATKEVLLDRFQGQQVDQIIQHLAHSDSPHTEQHHRNLRYSSQ